MDKKILAILGLRSGSKGLKNKNIRKLNKIPLFAHIVLKAKSQS
jgi:CMP-N-acetylneuraminic acid synthetase